MNKVYSTKEKLLLAQLVRENGVVENKKTDGATLVEKKKAWELIGVTYNSQPEVTTPRTPEQLRKLWNNLKQRKRKETTALRYSMLATGGGPPTKPDLDPVLQVVEEAAPSMDVTIICPWDSTSLFESEQAEARSQLVEEQSSTCADESNASAVSRASVEPCLSVSTSAASTCQSKNRKRLAASVMTERNVRVQRVTEAANQQQELHSLRQEIANEEFRRVQVERELAEKRAAAELQKAAVELEKAAVELKTAVSALKKAESEAELAALKLQEFKKRCGLDDN